MNLISAQPKLDLWREILVEYDEITSTCLA